MAEWKGFSSIDPEDSHREWRLIQALATNALGEQKKARRWGVIFKSLTFIYLFLILFLFWPVFQLDFGGAAQRQPHSALVRLDGVIAADEAANANAIVTGLRKAFGNEYVKGIVLSINSPGGSPVQAGYVYDEIMRLKSLYPDKKLYAVISDVGASGGYYIAAAADHIYANKASLVGSIGVTASSFGFVEGLQKLGIERRHFTAGDHKAFLDPFSPLKPSEKAFWQGVLDSTHQQFIAVVKQGRGSRLKPDPQLFSGLIWNGEQALELGLIDGLGSAGYVAREIIGEETIVDYSYKRSPFRQLIKDLGVSIGGGIGKTLKTSGVPVQFQ